MPYRLQWQRKRTEDRRQKVGALETVAENAEWCKVRRFVLRNQQYLCGHGTLPLSSNRTCAFHSTSIVNVLGRQTWYPANFVQKLSVTCEAIVYLARNT